MTSVPHLCQAAAMGWYAGQLWGAWGLLWPGDPFSPRPCLWPVGLGSGWAAWTDAGRDPGLPSPAGGPHVRGA